MQGGGGPRREGGDPQRPEAGDERRQLRAHAGPQALAQPLAPRRDGLARQVGVVSQQLGVRREGLPPGPADSAPASAASAYAAATSASPSASASAAAAASSSSAAARRRKRGEVGMAPLEEEAAEAAREGARSVRVQKGPGLEQVLALAQRQRERFVPRTRRGLRLRHEGAEQPATPLAELGAAPWRGEGPREKRRRVPSHEGAELGRGGLRGEAAWAETRGEEPTALCRAEQHDQRVDAAGRAPAGDGRRGEQSVQRREGVRGEQAREAERRIGRRAHAHPHLHRQRRASERAAGAAGGVGGGVGGVGVGGGGGVGGGVGRWEQGEEAGVEVGGLDQREAAAPRPHEGAEELGDGL